MTRRPFFRTTYLKKKEGKKARNEKKTLKKKIRKEKKIKEKQRQRLYEQSRVMRFVCDRVASVGVKPSYK